MPCISPALVVDGGTDLAAESWGWRYARVDDTQQRADRPIACGGIATATPTASPPAAATAG